MSKQNGKVWSYTKMRELIVDLRKQGYGWEHIRNEFISERIICAKTGKPYSLSGLKAIYHKELRQRRKEAKLFDEASKVVNEVCHEIEKPAKAVPQFSWEIYPSPQDSFLEIIDDIMVNKDEQSEDEMVVSVKAVLRVWKKGRELKNRRK